MTLRALVLATTVLGVVESSPPQERDASFDPTRVVFRPDRAPNPGESIPIGALPTHEVARVSDSLVLCGDGRITTPLPKGYPAPTAPGALELKTYGVVRKAEVGGAAAPDLASTIGFWKLFSHIKSRDIAMTSPVEIEYGGLSVDAEAGSPRGGAWSMAFLYREPSLGPTGDSGGVDVLDSTETTYLSAAALGNYGVDDAARLLPKLRAALAELPNFEVVGSVRVLHYNGPEAPAGRRWMEVQIPVRMKNAATPRTSDGKG
jgi:hypothetical protein